MAISLASLRRSGAAMPPRLLAYGVAGVGKTKLAADAPRPIFLQTEDGLGKITADTFGMLRSYEDVQDALDVLYREDHGFQTVVLDSLDWLEPMIWKRTCQDNNWPDIEKPGFGKGYIAALDVWRGFLDGMTLLRDERGSRDEYMPVEQRRKQNKVKGYSAAGGVVAPPRAAPPPPVQQAPPPAQHTPPSAPRQPALGAAPPPWRRTG